MSKSNTAKNVGQLTPANKKKKSFRRLELIRYWQYYIMAVPVMAVFFIFAYLPMPGIILAFKKYTVTGGIFGSPWNGFENFIAFFSGANIWRITRNILIINGANIIIGTSCYIAGAILINELFSVRFQKFYQNILFLPTFFSALLVSKFFNLMLDNDYGLINNVLKISGLDPIMWYDKAWYWPGIIVLANIWKGLGYGLIIYLASIIAIDDTIYEAARIDGATRP
jgi:putative aldouronate transport system permease protein